MEIHQQKHGAVTVVQPDGALVDADVPPFRQKVETIAQESMGRLVVDLTQMPYVDSAGLEALVDLTESLSRSGQTLRLCGVNETVREVLELTELSPQFEHYEDVNSAVRSFL